MVKKNEHKIVKTGFTNSYLLASDDGYLLIDTGYPQDYDKFVRKLEELHQIHLSEIKHLLLTHHHDDYAGFASALLENTKSTLIVHEKALERLKLVSSEETSVPLNKRIKMIFSFFDRFYEFKFPSVIPSERDLILKDSENNSEILLNLGINGTIIHTPGHTEDGISVILSDGSVFAGDNAMNAWYFNVLGIKKRPIYIQDIDSIFTSWERYIELGGKMIYPAYGKPFPIKQLQENLIKLKKSKK